ncbi:histone-lysine N-methyltransferase, H3 lysine-9 specific SUVH4-like [Papaver somniferum]|uniref:histone-lysine N-methyltransferase, H3 lysine-9 specific SUVH4-like n=1 Tax=Papaver somniferum TaxID=3469 RepID=UPI000E7013CD|nr:histone-lysine N-methyltransferase, H3 lysine-9 specific SUVH4-like [Papaver somniferum]
MEQRPPVMNMVSGLVLRETTLGLVCNDIRGRQENIPIAATNMVDDPHVAPTAHQCPSFCKREISRSALLGCNCKGVCIDSRKFACAKLNGSEFRYVAKDDGRYNGVI